MAKEHIVTGIDVGSTKISAVIASVSPEKKISIIGVSTVPSRGIKKGVVVDIDEAVAAISESLEGAERMAGYPIRSAFVTVDGKHISSLNSHGVVAVGGEGSEITEEDVERVTEAARAVSL
ncbi:MAG: cell division protein FtsA, partial [Patescibacteria group bacterium]